eukprot:CAMPEP_0197017454 /NCGR_PEP_ID=MMETSP1380-20130617/79549_1 /TAXON_ID=5936 /ORGANISM="Euplotes crassus, Strain CT5" /LENGTH=335 /DNA_ID=CAMNT_0042444553 /DNA_START=692 /DNA_END=1699 /DNA_ORIENTATION=+
MAEPDWNETIKNDTNFESFKNMMDQVSETSSVRHEYIPGSTTNSIISNSRRSPKLRSEIDSLKFDLDEEETVPRDRKNSKLSSRKACRSVRRESSKINDARAVSKGYISQHENSKMRENLNITTPLSVPMGSISRPDSTEYQHHNSAMNKSGFSNLQYQINKQRKIVPQSPIPASKKRITPITETENFTDISKVRPRSDLPPLEIKSKINFDIPGTIPTSKSKEMTRAQNHTTAYLYSKISNKPKIKKSNIIQNTEEPVNCSDFRRGSEKVSLQHKSTASSLIAALGQRKVKIPYPIKKSALKRNFKEILDASPRVSTENFDQKQSSVPITKEKS